MFRISNLNSQDTILDKIHAVQRKHYRERKRMNWREEKSRIDKNVRDFENRHNLKLKIIHPKEISLFVENE